MRVSPDPIKHAQCCYSTGQDTCTVWLKIRWILFKTHISHKWDNIMNLFEDIYKLWYLGRMWWKWHQNWCSNTEMVVLFKQIIKNRFTHQQYVYKYMVNKITKCQHISPVLWMFCFVFVFSSVMVLYRRL